MHYKFFQEILLRMYIKYSFRTHSSIYNYYKNIEWWTKLSYLFLSTFHILYISLFSISSFFIKSQILYIYVCRLKSVDSLSYTFYFYLSGRIQTSLSDIICINATHPSLFVPSILHRILTKWRTIRSFTYKKPSMKYFLRNSMGKLVYERLYNRQTSSQADVKLLR